MHNLPLYQILHQSGTSVTRDEPTYINTASSPRVYAVVTLGAVHSMNLDTCIMTHIHH